MTNHIFLNLSKEIIDSRFYQPDQQCFDWCITQQVTHSNNIELNVVMIVLFAYISLLVYDGIKDSDRFDKYKDVFIYIAKGLMIIFFAVYILMIRLGIKWQ